MIRLKHNLFFYLLCTLHLFLGLNACVGGLLLMIKNDGSLLGMQSGWLQHTPFTNYLIPGILLFAFLGVFPLFTFAGLIKKIGWHWLGVLNIYKTRYWAWAYSLYSGVIAIVWITTQLLLTQYFWIQPIILFTGLLIIVFTLIPGVMRQYELKNE